MKRKRTILVTDDKPILRRLLTETIRTHEPDTVILEAKDGREAEELATSFDLDVLFLDVEMPYQDGFSTLKNLREKNQLGDCRVVMCTGCDTIEDFSRGIELGADFYVTKPFDLPQIEELLNACNEVKSEEDKSEPRVFRSLCSALL